MEESEIKPASTVDQTLRTSMTDEEPNIITEDFMIIPCHDATSWNRRAVTRRVYQLNCTEQGIRQMHVQKRRRTSNPTENNLEQTEEYPSHTNTRFTITASE